MSCQHISLTASLTDSAVLQKHLLGMESAYSSHLFEVFMGADTTKTKFFMQNKNAVVLVEDRSLPEVSKVVAMEKCIYCLCEIHSDLTTGDKSCSKHMFTCDSSDCLAKVGMLACFDEDCQKLQSLVLGLLNDS